MGPWRSILVATDLSDAADEAIQQAQEQAQLCGARLTLLHVLPVAPGAPMEPGEVQQLLVRREQLSAELFETMTARVQSLAGAGGPGGFEAIVDQGLAADVIIARAEEGDADLVVVGATSKMGARRILGGVAGAVVRGCRRSVLVARPRAGTRRVLCAVDFSEPSLAAARAAVELCDARRNELQLVHAHGADEPAAEAAARLDEVVTALGQGAPKLVSGDPAKAIPALAADVRADLIVVGNRGRSGLRALLLGSVANAIARDAPCSVLVVSATGARNKH